MSGSTPKYLLVEKHIKQAIKNKQLTDKLPGERVLAKQLGYSYMTVRKAIDNLTNEGVLYKVPTKGSFVNNSGVRKQKSRTIGYFLDSSIRSGLSSPYYSLIFNTIEKEAAVNDYSVVYFSEVNERKLPKILNKLDGVIATCIPRSESTIQEIKRHLPVVVIDNSAADKSIPSVIIDNFNADIESVDYICSLGHQRIGFMTGLEDSDIGKSRYAGYQHGLEKNNINLDTNLVYRGNYSFEAGIQGADYFCSLEHSPSAIICANDSMALGAMQGIREKGLNIPQEISVVGFDDIEVASQITPALTTIAAPIDDIAKHAFGALQNLIMGEQPSQRHVVLAAHLVIRQTCAELRPTMAAA